MYVKREVTHSCTHTEERDLYQYNPYTRIAKHVRDVNDPTDSPFTKVQDRGREIAKAVRYWEKRLCTDCRRKASTPSAIDRI